MTGTIDVTAFTDFERAGWDRIPHGYHRFMGPITAQAAKPLLDAAGVVAGTHVLDVATGPGYVAGCAAAVGARAVGVDLSAGIIALARELNPGVAFHVADAADLPFADGLFDAVVSGFLLPHLADHRRALDEFCRVLRPGGTVACSTWDAPDRVPMLGLVVDAVTRAGARPPADLPAGPPFFKFSQAQALAGLLEEAGLSDIDVVTHAFVHRVRSADALWDGVLSGSVRTSALVARQPPAVRAAVRAEFDRLAEDHRSGDGLDLPVSVLIARGRLA